MKLIELFEEFIPVGFGGNSYSTYSLGASPNIDTGYNMDAIVGPVMEVGNCVAKEAYAYEANDNPDHTAESYIKEAKKHINQKIDEACESYASKNEAIIGVNNKMPLDESMKILKFKDYVAEKEKFKGGLADGMTAQDLADKHKLPVDEIEAALSKGQKVEMEHTDDADAAYEIAKDHIFEDPKYYDKLVKIEESRDPKSIRKEYDDLKKVSVQGLRDMWSRTHRVGNPKELDKEGLVMDILVAKHGAKYIEAAFESYESIDEANDYEYDPSAHAERLKRREQQNIERYRAAQDRQDNYAIALYELKIKLDKIDLEKLKVLKAIDDLKEKFDKK